jgi:type IV pilus assembly protein PilN
VIKINLLPIDERITQDDSRDRLWFVAGIGAFACAVMLVFSAYALQSHTLQTMEEEIATLEKLAEQYKPLIARVNEIAKERRDLEAKIAVITDLDTERSFRVRLLEDLNQKMPRYAWLTKFSEAEGASAEILGRTFSNLTLSDFMSKLEGSPLYENVDLSVTKKGEIGEREIFEFRMTTALVKAPVDTTTAPRDENAATQF